MKTTIRKRNVAHIELQKSFCQNCSHKIRHELQKIEDIANIVLYPDSAIVVFSFFRANELSKALNVLTELGYPEIGEDPLTGHFNSPIACDCQTVGNAA